MGIGDLALYGSNTGGGRVFDDASVPTLAGLGEQIRKESNE